jgi:hypothetical protein
LNEARGTASGWSACRAATIALAEMGTFPNLAVFYAGPQKPHKPIQKVENASQLRASTSEDRALADYFDRSGEPLLKVGHVQLLIGRHENPPAPAPPDGVEPVGTPVTPPDYLQTLVCNSAAIVVGQVVASRALLNRSETYLVTTYTVAVSEWIRPRGGPGTIQVAALGGQVQIGERSFSARLATVPLLASETPVLLFVNRVPGASHTLALHSPAVRIDSGVITPDDLPSGGEG